MVYVPKASAGVASTLTQPTSYPTRVVAGHTMVDLPGGWFVQGSAKYADATPRRVRLSPFSVGVTAVSEAQFRAVMGTDGQHGGNPASTAEMPATCVSWDQAVAYCVAVNAAQGSQLGLLTEAEGEYAGRGPVVDLHAVIQAEGIPSSDFARFVDERYENFVRVLGSGDSAFGTSHILTDANDCVWPRESWNDLPLYAWCMYAPAGKLDKQTAWYDRGTLPAAEWGPANGFGLKLVTGGVWEWRADTYRSDAYQTTPIEDPVHLTTGRAFRSLRGGSYRDDDRGRVLLRLACRGRRDRPGDQGKNVGFRVRAPQDSPA